MIRREVATTSKGGSYSENSVMIVGRAARSDGVPVASSSRLIRIRQFYCSCSVQVGWSANLHVCSPDLATVSWPVPRRLPHHGWHGGY
jgi:hypothetical protein